MYSLKSLIISKISYLYYLIYSDSFACLWPKYIPADNDPNWKDAFTTNLTSNRPNSVTCLQSKPYYSNNTNEQLANILG